MRSEEFWIKLQGAFNPEEVLVGDRKALFCKREHSPFDLMRLFLRPTNQPIRPPMAFFTGHRGSGKSSMLFRLMEAFKNDFFIVYFDVKHNADDRKINQIDILYLMGVAIFQAAARSNTAPDPKNLEELAKSVLTLTKTQKQTKNESANIVELTKNLICFGGGMLGGEMGQKLTDAFLKPFSLTSGISEEEARKREIEPQVQDIVNNVNLIIADVQTRTDKPLLVVVDGLDKLQRLEQAELIFLQSRALLGPVCRVIYTVPMLIYTSPGFAQTEEEAGSYLLPNIKLYERSSDEKRHEKGYETLREVVNRRLQTVGVQREEIFESDEALDMLILKSGGVMRGFISLVNNAFSIAEIKKMDKVNKEAAQRAIDDRAAQLSGRLTWEMVEELRKVRKTKWPSNPVMASELLHGLLMVAYRNRSSWFDAHPLLWEQLEEER